MMMYKLHFTTQHRAVQQIEDHGTIVFTHGGDLFMSPVTGSVSSQPESSCLCHVCNLTIRTVVRGDCATQITSSAQSSQGCHSP